MTIQTITVVGMTCGHCVAAVAEELEAVPGVRDVAVDLSTGRVDVTVDTPLAPEVVHAAVSEAGYELASGSPAITAAR